MDALRRYLHASPAHARATPYVLIVLLTVVQDGFEGPLRYWLYLAKMLVGFWCIWEVRREVVEARWAFSWEAVVVGILACVAWVGLDPYYPKSELLFKVGNPWNPIKEFGEGSALGLFFVAARTLLSAVVVPPIEEAFYRSFLYRWFVRTDFKELPMSCRHGLSFVVTALLFGLAHYQWLGGVVCAMAYQWLVIRKNRLGDAMTAHAITNFLLGIWIYWRGDWKFW